MTNSSQRSSLSKTSLPRDKSGLRTLQSGQEEDFLKTSHFQSTSSLSSALINSIQMMTINSSINSTLSNPNISESNDLVYKRYIKQGGTTSPPIKLSSCSPTKLKTNHIQGHANTPGTSSTTSSASLQSNSFQTTPSNWTQNYYSHQNNQIIDSESNSKSSEIAKNYHMNKTSKFSGNTPPPQSPAFFRSGSNYNNNGLATSTIVDDDGKTIGEHTKRLSVKRLKPARLQNENKRCVVSVCFFSLSF